MPNLRRRRQAQVVRHLLNDDSYHRDCKELNMLTLEVCIWVAAEENRRRKVLQLKTEGHP